MSCLYSSPEVTSLSKLALDRRCHGSPGPVCARRIETTQFHTDLPYVAVNKDAFPTGPACSQPHQIIPPAKTSTGFEREFSSAISGFRSLCGRKRRSSQSHRALLDLRFGTFHSGRALALRTLAFTRSVYGASNPGPTLWRERSRSRGIFQVVFCVPIGLYGGNLPNAAARGIPARSSLGGPWSASPAGAINRQTSSLWPSPNSTTSKPPGASRRAASGAMAR